MNCLDFRPQHSCQYSQVKQSENSGLHVRALRKLEFFQALFCNCKIVVRLLEVCLLSQNPSSS